MKQRMLDPWRIVTALLIAAAITVAGVGYLNNQANYANLLSLYAKQQIQLRSHGITPAGPSANEIEKQGPPGATGPAGQNATDSQVESAVGIYCHLRLDCAGPQGLPGPNGASGANGTNGSDGAAGATGPAGPTGPAGADGQPPVSWTYADALGLQHTCTRTSPFDPSAPTYQCT